MYEWSMGHIWTLIISVLPMSVWNLTVEDFDRDTPVV